MLVDLDVLPDAKPTWRERWLLPAALGLLLAVVLAGTFARYTPARASVLRAAPPATGVKAIELPRTLATLESRLQFSGTTGLASMEMSDGFRDNYRLADGRLVIVIEYPVSGALITPAARIAVPVRGVRGAIFDTPAPSQPVALAWVADGMQYQVGGAFTAEELISIAEQLR